MTIVQITFQLNYDRLVVWYQSECITHAYMNNSMIVRVGMCTLSSYQLLLTCMLICHIAS